MWMHQANRRRSARYLIIETTGDYHIGCDRKWVTPFDTVNPFRFNFPHRRNKDREKHTKHFEKLPKLPKLPAYTTHSKPTGGSVAMRWTARLNVNWCAVQFFGWKTLRKTRPREIPIEAKRRAMTLHRRSNRVGPLRIAEGKLLR